MNAKSLLHGESLSRKLAFHRSAAGKHNGPAVNEAPHGALHPWKGPSAAATASGRGEIASLSFAQRRVWFLTQLDSDGFAYNRPAAMRLAGDLDIATLRRALSALIERQTALRTLVATSKEGMPVQVIRPPAEIDLPIIDLSNAPAAERDRELESALRQSATRRFDLNREFPFRALLVRLEAAVHVLFLGTHEIACDRRSLEIIWRELGILYGAFLEDSPNPLPELPLQYADYALAQRRQWDGEAATADLSYWKRQLAGVPLLELPGGRPHPAVQTLKGASRSLTLSSALAARLRALTRSRGVGPYTGMLAAFQVLLFRYTGQEDISVGSPIDARTDPELKDLVGPLENTLVFRTDLSGNPSFSELLDRVEAVVGEGLKHGELPFEKLVEEVVPDRDLSHTPLFQVAFSFEDTAAFPKDLPALSAEPIDIETGAAKFDLTLNVRDCGSAIQAALRYKTDLFDDSTIARLLDHFGVLLESFADDPEQKIGNADMLTAAEKDRLVGEWKTNRRDYPREKCIHQLFEEQVERSPDATAVVCAGQRLTYAELNRRANRVAHHLRGMGVRPNMLVAISLERSIDMVAAVYGTLKSGAAYVPLDPEYPGERLDYMLESSQAAVLLTQSRFRTRWKNCRPEMICIDTEWETIAPQRTENPVPWARPGDLIYVIFTSGSTGRPKAAGVYHRGFVNLLQWFTESFSIARSDRALLVSSLSFDLTQKNLYGALIRGGELHLLPGDVYDPAEIARIIQEQKITLVNCTPSAFYPLIEQEASSAYEKLTSLRIVFLGGEPISIGRLRPWLKSSVCRCEVANTYGPTECTDICAFYRLTAANIDAYPFVPTGKPIFNTELLVLNRDLGVCPAGVAGELCVAGEGVGAGYINDRELTSRKFVAPPFREVSSEKMYRTNDLVRLLPDGNIEFIGRADYQVKLRGFRIEPGEIEAVLSQHPAIREAAVTVREDTPADKRLVGYIVGKNGPVTSKQMRAYLADRLPRYMIPAVFVVLEKLPLTPNGKVDRRALPPPNQIRAEFEEPAVAARTPAERKLAAIWARLLGVDGIGVHDNFFELGGDSLMAVRLVREIESTTGKKLPLAALFQAPTVEQLARLVAVDETLPSWSSLYPIQPQGWKPPFFWIHGENSDALLSRHLGPDQPLYGVRHQGEDGTPARYGTVAEIAAYYLDQIRAVQPGGPYHLGGYCFGGMVAFEIAQRLQKLDQDVALLFFLDLPTPNLTAAAPAGEKRSGASHNEPFLTGRILRHLDRLRALDVNAKIEYVLCRARAEFSQTVAPAGRAFQRLVYKACLSAGTRLPLFVRARYVLDIYDRAIASYVPQPYAGRVVMLKAAPDCEPEKWRAFIGAESVIREIRGDHTSVLKEPYVGQWAALLKDEIERIHRTSQQNKPGRARVVPR